MKALPSLDGLRGLAVTLVFLRHAAYLGGHRENLPPLLGPFMLNGWLGVDLFFVLSGFLISRPFFHDRTFEWKQYLTQRALRILPAYLFVLGLVITVPFLVAKREFPAFRIAYHVMFLQDYLGSDLLVVLWSLGVEEKFYLLAPLVLPWVLRFRNSRTQCCILVAILMLGPIARALTITWAGCPEGYLEFFRLYRSPFHACIDGLCFGVLLARLETMRLNWVSPQRARSAFWIAATLLAASMCSHVFLDYIGAGASILRATVIGFAWSLLVGSAVFEGAPDFLQAPLSRWLGRISYSVYLIHVPLIFLAAAITNELLAFLVTSALLTLAAGHLMFVSVEEPFNKLRAKIRLRNDKKATLGGGKLPIA
jgi:peptidoglycan/LPS O-acetylase OafA/YrhL